MKILFFLWLFSSGIFGICYIGCDLYQAYIIKHEEETEDYNKKLTKVNFTLKLLNKLIFVNLCFSWMVILKMVK